MSKATAKTVKAALSIQSGLYEKAESVARELNMSRSQLYSLAVEEFLRRHENRLLLQRINEAYADDLNDEERAFIRAGSRRAIQATAEDEW
jgi:hypothetical protein